MEFVWGIYCDDTYSDHLIILTPLHKTEEGAKKRAETLRKESKAGNRYGEEFHIRKIAVVSV